MPTIDPAVIKVWRFEDAPTDLQALSTNGGDEDWLALIPPELAAERWAMGWLDSQAWGCADSQDYTLADGSIVCIGSHA